MGREMRDETLDEHRVNAEGSWRESTAMRNGGFTKHQVQIEK